MTIASFKSGDVLGNVSPQGLPPLKAGAGDEEITASAAAKPSARSADWSAEDLYFAETVLSVVRIFSGVN